MPLFFSSSFSFASFQPALLFVSAVDSGLVISFVSFFYNLLFIIAFKKTFVNTFFRVPACKFRHSETDFCLKSKQRNPSAGKISFAFL